jgi:Uma2 family endonuclease
MGSELGTTGLGYDDLARFPDDLLRRELIDGELIVSAAPAPRHQEVVGRLTAALLAWADAHGAKVYPAPTDVRFTDDTVLEPDVVVVGPERRHTITDRWIGAPDLVVEVSSPTTRSLDLVRKRAVYERERVPEYWFVDLEAERVEVHRVTGDRYPPPVILQRGDRLAATALAGFSTTVDAVVGPWG